MSIEILSISMYVFMFGFLYISIKNSFVKSIEIIKILNFDFGLLIWLKYVLSVIIRVYFVSFDGWNCIGLMLIYLCVLFISLFMFGIKIVISDIAVII